MYIYKTTNLINGMIYVGQSIRNSKDSTWYIGSGNRFQDAVREYGKKNFLKEILEDDIDKELLNEREIYWINFYNSVDPAIGYNVLKGGSFPGLSEILKITFSRPDVQIKTSARNAKLWTNPVYRKKVTDSNRKTWGSNEKKKEHSERLKLAYSDPEKLKNLKEGASRMEIKECPHCGKKLKANIANGSHFENCVYHTNLEKRELAIERRNRIIQETVKIKCPYCEMIGVVGNMRRWHFDNCRFRKVE